MMPRCKICGYDNKDAKRKRLFDVLNGICIDCMIEKEREKERKKITY